MIRSTYVCALVSVLSGCLSYGHSRPLDAVPMPAAPGDRFEIWIAGKGHSLHAVRIDGDTLRGVPWSDAITCDSCAIAFARSSVDSVRVPTVDPAETGILAVFLAPIFFALILSVAMGGPGS